MVKVVVDFAPPPRGLRDLYYVAVEVTVVSVRPGAIELVVTSRVRTQEDSIGRERSSWPLCEVLDRVEAGIRGQCSVDNVLRQQQHM